VRRSWLPRRLEPTHGLTGPTVRWPSEDGGLLRFSASKDQVHVTLTKRFWLVKFEVTRAQWRHVAQTTPWHDQRYVKEGDNFPATYISWDDATEFCKRLTEDERRAVASGSAVPSADRCPMGICVPGGSDDSVQVWRRRVAIIHRPSLPRKSRQQTSPESPFPIAVECWHCLTKHPRATPFASRHGRKRIKLQPLLVCWLPFGTRRRSAWRAFSRPSD
jgi:hypothetical protein